MDSILDSFQVQQHDETKATWSMAHLPFQTSPPLFQPYPCYYPMESRASQMFLLSAQLPKDEKVLHIIIDFVDNFIPHEDERTMSDGGHAKTIVSYSPEKT